METLQNQIKSTKFNGNPADPAEPNKKY